MALTLDFAFEGFRLIAKKPGLFLGWCGFYILISIASFAAAAVLSGPALMNFISQAANTTANNDPTVMLSLLSGMWPGVLAALVIAVIGSLMFRCAVYRGMLKPGQTGPAYLRLGGDELRQFLLGLLMIVVVLVLYLAIAIIAGIIIALSMASQNELVKGLGTFVAIVMGVCFTVWFMLRISLISVHSFDKAKIDLGGALKLTKGNMWTLLGGYIILFLLLIIMQIVVTCIFYGVTLVSTGFNPEPLRQAANPDLTQFMTMMGPVFIAQILIGVLTTVLSEVAFLAAQVAAYQALTPTPAATVASAFDTPEPTVVNPNPF